MTQNKFESEFKKIVNTDKLEATIETKLGGLYIHCLEGWIHMRFVDDSFSFSKFFAKFSEFEAINKFSKKWNIHMVDKEDCLCELDSRLNTLMN